MSNQDFIWTQAETRSVGQALIDYSGVLTLEIGNEITKINAWQFDGPLPIQLARELRIPTYICFDKDAGIRVGTEAKAAQKKNPDYTVHGFINLIGLEKTDMMAIVTVNNQLYKAKKRDGPFFITVTDNKKLYKSLPRKERRLKKWFRVLQNHVQSDAAPLNHSLDLSLPSASFLTLNIDWLDPKYVESSDAADETTSNEKFSLRQLSQKLTNQLKLWEINVRKKISKSRGKKHVRRVNEPSNNKVEAAFLMEPTDFLRRAPSKISIDDTSSDDSDAEAAIRKNMELLKRAGTSQSFARKDYEAAGGVVRNFVGGVEGTLEALGLTSTQEFGQTVPAKHEKAVASDEAAGPSTSASNNDDPKKPVYLKKFDGGVGGTEADLGVERNRLLLEIDDIERYGARIFEEDRELDQHLRIASMRSFDPLLIDCGPGGDDINVQTLIQIFVEDIVDSLVDSFDRAGLILPDSMGLRGINTIVFSPSHFSDYQNELLFEAVRDGGLAIHPMSNHQLLCESKFRILTNVDAARLPVEALIIDIGMQNFQLSYLDRNGNCKVRGGKAGFGVERMMVALENAILVSEWPRNQGYAQRSSKERLTDRAEALRVFQALTVQPSVKKDGKANFNINWEGFSKQCPVTFADLKDACEMTLTMMKEFVQQFLDDNGIDGAKERLHIELIGGYSNSIIFHEMCREVMPACEIFHRGLVKGLAKLPSIDSFDGPKPSDHKPFQRYGRSATAQ
ncbi:unnamed protein product, partial [Mesorhabditis spiculigera]